MNAIIETLVDIVERDPYPAGFTSSYWKDFGERNIVKRTGGELVLQPLGIGSVKGNWLVGHTLHVIERLTYRSVSAGLKSYPATWKLAKTLARDLGFGRTFDIWKYAVVLAVLQDHWDEYQLSPKRFVVIGDGHGFLGALIRRHIKDAVLYCIDIPKTMVFQVRNHGLADPAAKLALMGHGGEEGADVTFVLPEYVQQIKDSIDCTVNTASMQEMNAFTIAYYFDFLRQRSTRDSRFYCVNRIEKILPGGEVVRFAEFPWRKDDEIFIDGVCPYYTHFFALETLPNGPRFLGIRIPFVNYFDGVHLHRLVRLAP